MFNSRYGVVGMVLLISGCVEQAPPPLEEAPVALPTVPVPFTLTEAQASGRQLYETMCWSCHGTSGRGDGPAVAAGVASSPPDFLSSAYANVTLEDLEHRFRSAVEGADPTHPHMQYVASMLRPERFREALSYVPVLAYPPEIRGSSWAGMGIFQLRCSPCHGVSGVGNGVAASALTIMPANLTSDTLVARRDFEAVFTRIKEGGSTLHGTSMPPWGMLLDDSTIWDLVAYVATLHRPAVLATPPGAG